MDVVIGNPLQKDLEAAVYEYWMSVQSLDPERFGANFAPDATLEDPAGNSPVIGRDAIAAFYGEGLKLLRLARITPRIKEMHTGVGQSTEVVVRWELTADTTDGTKQAKVHGIGLFKFKPAQVGARLLLESVREFYDPFEWSSQFRG